MTPRIPRPSFHETRARAAKADALYAEIMRMARELKCGADRVQPFVTTWGRREWASLAINCGQRPPSEETIRAVLAQLARAALVERLADSEPMLSSERDTRRLDLVEP